MKIQSAMLWKSGAAAGSVLLLAMVAVTVMLHISVRIYESQTIRHAEEVLRRAAYFQTRTDEARLGSFFASTEKKLELLLLKSIQGPLRNSDLPISTEIRSARIITQSPSGTFTEVFPAGGTAEIPIEFKRFFRFPGHEKFSVAILKKTHEIWALFAVRNTDGSARLAAFKLNPTALIGKSRTDFSPHTVRMLCHGGRILAVYSGNTASAEPSGALLKQMRGLAFSLPVTPAHPGSFATEDFRLKETPSPNDRWTLSATVLGIPTTPPEGLRFATAIPYSHALENAEQVHKAQFDWLYLFLFLIGLAGLLIFLLLQLLILRPVIDSVLKVTHFVSAITRGENSGDSLHLEKSDEYALLSTELNHLRDKMSGTLVRLKRSHDRELSAKREAEDANRLKNALLTELSLMMKEPLGILIGYSDSMLKHGDLSPENASALRRIHTQSLELNRISARVGRLIELDSTGTEPSYTEFDLMELIQETFEHHRANAAARHIKYEMHYSKAIADKVVSDREILSGVLNLALGTLIQSSETGSTVSFEFENREDHILFRIASSGAPDGASVAGEYLRYLSGDTCSIKHGFAPFFLDLAIMKSKAEIIGAAPEITARSGGADSLIEFAFSLDDPAGFDVSKGAGVSVSPDEEKRLRSMMTSSVSITTSERTRLVPISRKIGVIIANRSESSQALLSMMLENDSALSIHCVKTFEECLDTVRKGGTDLLLLDTNLKEDALPECIAKLRETAPGTIIFVLSPVLIENTRKSWVTAGADLCIQKPVIPEELLARIHEFVVREKSL